MLSEQEKRTERDLALLLKTKRKAKAPADMAGSSKFSKSGPRAKKQKLGHITAAESVPLASLQVGTSSNSVTGRGALNDRGVPTALLLTRALVSAGTGGEPIAGSLFQSSPNPAQDVLKALGWVESPMNKGYASLVALQMKRTVPAVSTRFALLSPLGEASCSSL